jgi:hypothetical protein
VIFIINSLEVSEFLKYFSSVVIKPVNTGGKKLISDLQEIVNLYLKDEKISFKEYSYHHLRNIIYLILPQPNSSYLLFNFLGNPFFAPPLVVFYTFFFTFVAFKKRVVKEYYCLIAPDLFILQSSVAKKTGRFFINFQCILEKLLLGHVADSIISPCPEGFLKKEYPRKDIIELEFLDHINSLKSKEQSSQKIHLLYCGDFGNRKGISLAFIEKILVNLDPSADFWMVATGVDAEALQKLQKHKNFVFLGQKEISELNLIAKECAFGLILYTSDIQYYNIMPSIKLSFYISNGLTILSFDLSRTRQLNDKYKFGYVLGEDELLSTLRHLSTLPAKRNLILEKKICNGHFLYEALKKTRLK